MQSNVIIAGFGGQGVLLIGKMLAYAGLAEGKEVSWFPSYGPEMRGGTANCTVVISDRPIGSPVIQSPFAVIALNQPSLDKFEPAIKPKGLLVMNTSLIERHPKRDDVEVIRIAANQIAMGLGNGRAANMVALGAYVGFTKIVSVEQIEALILEQFGKKPEVHRINLEAFKAGFTIGMEYTKEEKA
jgi:2-oxoglutarate ferredoxin oxidoreductase subunit gamma